MNIKKEPYEAMKEIHAEEELYIDIKEGVGDCKNEPDKYHYF